MYASVCPTTKPCKPLKKEVRFQRLTFQKIGMISIDQYCLTGMQFCDPTHPRISVEA